MKTLYLVFALISLASLCAEAQDDENVLSYFAVSNSIDGQLMADTRNILRFFPVYAMQRQIDSVQITVYYGGNIYSRRADSRKDGKYWEALLPTFKLGEAIQRLEVEVHLTFDEMARQRFPDAEFAERDLILKRDSLDQLSQSLRDSLLARSGKLKFEDKSAFAKANRLSNAEFAEIGISSRDADRCRRHYEADYESYLSYRDSLLRSSSMKGITADKIDDLTRQRVQLLVKYLGDYEEVQKRDSFDNPLYPGH